MPKAIRQIRVDGNIAYVPLTKGYEAVINAADVPLVERWNWFPLVTPRTVYAHRMDYSGDAPRGVRLHRLLMGEPEGFEVDHQDCDGLNNRRKNLRVATKSQNMQNQRLRSTSKSGFKGVCFRKDIGKWMARIKVNGKQHHLGCFTTAEDAHAAYVAASDRLHGDFGRVA